MIKKYLEVGKIVTTHGIKGEVKVQPWCNEPSMICGFKHLYFNNGDDIIVVRNVRVQKNMIIIKFDGFDTPEEALKLRNKILYINRDDIKLDEDTYFIQDLIGLKVIDVDTDEEYGEIVDVTETGANDVYHIKSKTGKLLYAPAIADVVIKTDIIGNTMLIRPLKGLFDDED